MGRAFRVYFDVPGLDVAIRELNGFNIKQSAMLEDVISESVKQISKSARRMAPRRKAGLKKSKSGKPLYRSIRTKFDKKEMAGYVMAKKPSAHLIEFGARAFTLKPKNKKRLKFQMNGETVFAKKSEIPERAAQPFMTPAYEQEKPILISKIKRIYAKQ